MRSEITLLIALKIKSVGNISKFASTIIPNKLGVRNNYAPSNNLLRLLAFTWFASIFALFWLYSITHITLGETLKIFLFFSVVLTLIPYQWISKFLPIDFSFMVALNFIGIGPLLTVLFLLLNLIFATNPQSHTDRITHYHRGETGFTTNDVVIQLKDKHLEEPIKFRSFDYYNTIEILETHPYFQYTIKQGAFGYDVILNTQFLTTP